MSTESAAIFRGALIGAWLMALADIGALAAFGPGVDASTAKAALAALVFGTLVGICLGIVAALLYRGHARLSSARRAAVRVLATVVHPVGVMSIAWAVVSVDLITGAGISASSWRVPVFIALLVTGLVSLVAGYRLVRWAVRHRLRALRVVARLGLVCAAGTAYASGLFYPNSYHLAHSFMFLVSLVALGLLANSLLASRWLPRRRVMAVTGAGLAAAAIATLVAIPLTGTPRALAFRHSQTVRNVVYQSSRLLGRTTERRIEFDAEAGAEFEAQALPACDDKPARDHDIIFVSVDSLRADRLAETAPDRTVVPRIDDLGQRALLFTAGYSPSPSTATSLVPLISGNSALALREMGRIPSTVASELRRLGYHTVTFEPFGSVSRRTFPGVSPKTLGFAKAMRAKSAAEFADKVISLLEKQPRKPLFVYHHLLEPHVSYQKHPGFNFGETMIDRFDSEVAYVDHHLGRIIDAVDRLGRRDHTIIAITADHGEAFYEHGLMGHGLTLYEEMIRVPIVIAAPGVDAALVRAPVSTLDIAPTLMALIGCGFTTAQEGSPLWADGHVREPAEVVVVRQYNEHERGRGFVRRVATLVGTDKLIEDLLSDVHELYDLEADAAEQHNLISDKSDLADRLRRANEQVRKKIGWVVAKNSEKVESVLSRRVRAGADGATRAALERIKAEPKAGTSLALVDALGSSPDTDSDAVLIELLSVETLPPGLSRRAVRMLAQRNAVASSRWIELARTAALADAARAEIFSYVSETGGQDGLGALTELAASDPSASIAAAAAEELCKAADLPDGLGEVIRRRFPAAEDLTPLPVQSVRGLLACLGREPSDADIDYLFAVYDTPVAKKKHSIYVIIEALGHAKNDRPLARLSELTRHHWEPVRAAAVRALAELATPGARDFFAGLAGKNAHLELGATLVHQELVERARRVDEVWSPSTPVPLVTAGGMSGAGLAPLVEAVDTALVAGGGRALLALHLRRTSETEKPGTALLAIGGAKRAEIAVHSFSAQQAAPIYLELSAGELGKLEVSYAQGEVALEVVRAELIWL